MANLWQFVLKNNLKFEFFFVFLQLILNVTIMNNLIAFCGLDCAKCYAYLATRNNDQALRERTARLWSELNGTTILPEHINCQGCRMDGAKTVFCEQMCQMRPCAMAKGFETCGGCAAMDDCEKLKSITSNRPDALENLRNW